jgi:hypothetical protein
VEEKSRILKKVDGDQSRPVAFNDSFGGGDNQLRFQQLENRASTINVNKDQQVSSLPKEEFLPGSSQPQDLGTISYKDTETQLETQQTQSIDTTTAIVIQLQKNSTNLQRAF